MVSLDDPPATINEVWDLQLQRTAYQKKVLELWNETEKKTNNGNVMDAFIMPIAPFAAVSHNNYDHVSYTTCVRLLKDIWLIRLISLITRHVWFR